MSRIGHITFHTGFKVFGFRLLASNLYLGALTGKLGPVGFATSGEIDITALFLTQGHVDLFPINPTFGFTDFCRFAISRSKRRDVFQCLV